MENIPIYNDKCGASRIVNIDVVIKKCIYFSIAWIFVGTISTTLLKVYFLKEDVNILLDFTTKTKVCNH